MIAKELSIPVYGIGAGDKVDGQLVIFHDLMGLFWEFKSKFVKRYCEAGQIMQNALKQYAAEVRSGVFPAQENFYAIKEELEKLLGGGNWKVERVKYETDQGFPQSQLHAKYNNKERRQKKSMIELDYVIWCAENPSTSH